MARVSWNQLVIKFTKYRVKGKKLDSTVQQNQETYKITKYSPQFSNLYIQSHPFR